MGVKNFSFCILLTRPLKHALSEFQLFTAPLTLIITHRWRNLRGRMGLGPPTFISGGAWPPTFLPKCRKFK